MVNTKPWDASEYLKTEQDIIEYLDAAAETGDPTLMQSAN